MPKFRIAHIREQGQDIIIVPLDRNFDQKTDGEREGAVIELQQRAMAARLAGRVVPVWPGSGSKMKFIAPQQWHPYFRGLNYQRVVANLNKELYW